MNQCEYCGEVSEYDVLIQGDYLRVCRKCLNDDMVIVEKPTKQQIEWSYKRPTVKQILSGISGTSKISGMPSSNNAPSLSMLRTPTKDSLVKKRLADLKILSPDQPRNTVTEREPKAPSPAINISPEKRSNIESEDEFLDI